jgi:DNA-binding Lrp family transcriptional regulator
VLTCSESIPVLSRADEQIVHALSEDGRMSFEAIARRCGVSEATVRRRTDWLLENDCLHLRAIVKPEVIGRIRALRCWWRHGTW